MQFYKGFIAAMLAGLMFTGLSACEKEGSAEKAGKAIDEAASSVTDSAKDAGKAVEKKMEDE